MGESSRGLTDSKHVPGGWQCDDASNRPCSATGSPSPGLTGTSWQLVRFEGGDSKILTPDDRTKYAIEFAADGRLAARTDCNRERGTWKSSGTNQISLWPSRADARQVPFRSRWFWQQAESHRVLGSFVCGRRSRLRRGFTLVPWPGFALVLALRFRF